MAETLFTWTRLDPVTIRDLADRCIERANQARWPADQADACALEFFLGAAVGAVMAGSTIKANLIADVATQHVAKHGLAGVRDLTTTNEKDFTS